MLKALWRYLWPLEAEKPQSGQRERYVTDEQLELALEKFSRNQEYELNEWYEKFSTLHARLSKRDKRKATAVEQEEQDIVEPPISVLQFRRLGSP